MCVEAKSRVDVETEMADSHFLVSGSRASWMIAFTGRSFNVHDGDSEVRTRDVQVRFGTWCVFVTSAGAVDEDGFAFC